MTSARVAFGDRAAGDFSSPADTSYTWLRQVHGARAVTVTRSGEHAGTEADAAVTAVPGARLLIRTADCAPVAFVGESASGAPVVGVAHAGWRGLEAGVLAATVDSLRALGAVGLNAQLGPCIGPECYEFGEPELGRLVERFGPSVRAETAEGRPALDLRAGVAAALAELGVPLDPDQSECTACDAGRWFSHRARADVGRLGTFVWIEP